MLSSRERTVIDEAIAMKANGKLADIKSQILSALSHDEAEDGLYFQNFFALGDEDERTPVKGQEHEILDALNDLIREGRVKLDESHDKVIFHLIK